MPVLESKEDYNLRKELYDLFKLIQRIRQEIASIKSPQDHFSDMTDQLDAIVGSTAIATNEIMENVEKINDLAFELKKNEVAGQSPLLDEIVERVGNVIVACSFQDITGQRVSKIVKAIRYIETRVNTLVSMWGEDQIAHEKVTGHEETDEYKKYLHGPALPGQGLDQAAADSLLQNSGGAANNVQPAAVEKAKPPAKKKEATPAVEEPVAEEPASEPLDQSSIDALFG